MAPEIVSRLAAIVFDRDEDPDAPLREFVAAARAGGVRIAGFMQEHADDEKCAAHDVRLRNLDTDATLQIMQDLGAQSEGCRVDPAAIAAAARMLETARERNPDLILVNRFGRLESEGGGMLGEIGRAVADGDALIICVPLRYREAWNAFADGLDSQLPPQRAAIEKWWARVVSSTFDV